MRAHLNIVSHWLCLLIFECSSDGLLSCQQLSQFHRIWPTNKLQSFVKGHCFLRKSLEAFATFTWYSLHLKCAFIIIIRLSNFSMTTGMENRFIINNGRCYLIRKYLEQCYQFTNKKNPGVFKMHTFAGTLYIIHKSKLDVCRVSLFCNVRTR